MNEYGSDIDKVNNTTMLNDFQSFTTTYDHSMSIDLANIIGKSIYGYNNWKFIFDITRFIAIFFVFY